MLREREAGADEETTGARSVKKGNVRRSYSFPIISERRRDDRESGEETEQGVCRKETHENDEGNEKQSKKRRRRT
jgi:hypothetical protein